MWLYIEPYKETEKVQPTDVDYLNPYKQGFIQITN